MNKHGWILTAFCAACFYTVGVKWAASAVRVVPIDGWTLLLALIWLFCGAVWTARAVREWKKTREDRADENRRR